MQSNLDSTQQPAPQKSVSISLIRLVGYGLLLLTLLDFGAILLPPQLMNPVWEFETMGAIVERIPVPLLALGFIFFGDSQLRGQWERLLLKVLSWASLAFAVFLVLLIPFWGISSTIRINNQTVTQMTTQYDARSQQLTELEAQLNEASPDDIATFLQDQGVELEELEAAPKEQMLMQLTQAKTRVQTEFENQQTSQRNTLIKSSLKWNLSALISSALFAYLWHLTRWARLSDKRKAPQNRVAKQS